MRISVVTIVRNAPDDLERTIASVLEQTSPPGEHVVVDGASTDRTLAVAEGYAAAHPERVVLRSEPDSGIADALNKGTALAGGDLVVCMNAGDRFADPAALERIREACRTAPPGAILYGDAELAYPEFRSYKRVDHRRLASPFTFWNPLNHQAMAVPREAMARHPFDASLRYSMDLDAWLHLLGEGRPFVHVGSALCLYAIGGVSSKPANFPAILEEHLRVYRKHGLLRKEFPAAFLRLRLALERLGGAPLAALVAARRRRRRA